MVTSSCHFFFFSSTESEFVFLVDKNLFSPFGGWNAKQSDFRQRLRHCYCVCPTNTSILIRFIFVISIKKEIEKQGACTAVRDALLHVCLSTGAFLLSTLNSVLAALCLGIGRISRRLASGSKHFEPCVSSAARVFLVPGTAGPVYVLSLLILPSRQIRNSERRVYSWTSTLR